MSAPDQARVVAFEVLRAVDESDAYANLALKQALARHRVTGRDAAFATELVSGTLRLRGSYDPIIDSLVSRALEPAVRDVLRLGAHQLLSTRVPVHAAISTSVELCRRHVGHRTTGLVNAVLRKVAAHTLEQWLVRLAPDPSVDETGHLAMAYSHPEWIISALAQALDRPAELDELLAADNARPLVTLVARPGLCTVEELQGTQTVSPIGVDLASGDPGQIEAVRQGRAGVQDAGSQLVALAMADVPIEGPDARWLDLCAGPGGKAALLAALADQRGAHLVANEVAPHRADLVRHALRGTSAEVVCSDGTDPAFDVASFDRVLVDAPCSGLGALRRRPEARWRRTPDDLAPLISLQRRLLSSALSLVRPGGVVLYATCSPVVAETTEVISEVLGEQVQLVPLSGPDDSQSAHLGGAVQLWPHRHRTDAMFYVALQRS